MSSNFTHLDEVKMASKLMVAWPLGRVGYRNIASKLHKRTADTFTIRFNSSYKQQLQEIEKHAQETSTTWRNISLFVAFPVCSYLFYKHIIVGEHMEKPKEFIAYSHLRIRKKPFPWGDGDKSLFHNPDFNVGPDTVFEEENEEKEEEHVPFITRMFLKLMEPEEETIRWRDEHLRRCRLNAIENIERRRKPQLPPIPIDVFAIHDKIPKPEQLDVDD